MPLFLLGLGLTTAYWGGIPAFAIAPRWAVLCFCPLLFMLRPIEMRSAHWVGLAVLGWAALSLAWVPVELEGLDGMAKLLLLASAFMVGSTFADLRPLFAGAAAGMLVNAAVAALQLTGWGDIQQLSFAPAGLLGNKNFLGETAALVLFGVVGSGRWRIASALACLFCVLASGCREAWLAVGLGAATWLALWGGKRVRALEAAACITGAVLLSANVGNAHWGDIGDRILIWEDTLLGLTWAGRGIGSFMVAYPEHAQYFNVLVARPEFAHNDFLQLLFELGPLGAGLALWAAAYCIRGADTCARCFFVVAVVECCLGFPLHLPATGGLIAVVAGYAARRSPRLRDVLAVVRTPVGAWLAPRHIRVP